MPRKRKGLPIVRQEFGFKRTSCDCNQCQEPCRFLPGFLVPADLERIRQVFRQANGRPFYNMLDFAEAWLLASPGAIVANGRDTFRIPTIVPARNDLFECVFFDQEDKKCAIHTVSPYGCAFFDFHMDHQEGEKRSLTGLKAISKDFQDQGLYSRVWYHLNKLRLTAPSPEEGRAMMRVASEVRKAEGEGF